MLLNITFGKTLFGLALTVISYFVLPCAYGQFPHTTFVPVAPAELSSSFVRCVYKDSRGFMWFGTATGLIRFDGTSVFRYETDQVNGNAVVSNSINAIIEDDKNNLWIGTANGLAIYNPQRDNFIDVDLIPENMNHLTSKYISALAVDSSGRIWIATHGQGLNIYDPRTFTFTYLKYPTTPNKIPPGNYITSLCFSDNTMWVGTKGGLKLFDARHVTPATLPVKDESVAAKEITQVKQDGEGNMWLATVDREIIKLTSVGEHYKIKKYALRPDVFTEAEANILTLSFDAKGNLWAAGENSGLNYLDTETDQVLRLEAEEGNPRKLPTNSIRYVYVDNTGVTWIGTYNRGAFIIDNKAKKFDLLQRPEFINAGIMGDNVKDLIEDKDGYIWIACDGGGLGRLDPVTNKIEYNKEINDKLGTRHLSSLLLDADGHLWIGSWGRGVYRLNIRSHDVANYKIESRGFGDNKVFCFYQDSRKTIWVGTAGSGLFYWDTKTDRFVPHNEEKNSEYIKKSAYVTSLLEDADNVLWIGTLFGLYQYTYKYGDVYDVTLHLKSDINGSIGSATFVTIFEDTRKNIWFGTGDNGLSMLPYRGSVFKNVQRHDGLVSNVIRGILPDARGNMWLSTSTGLCKYDPVKNAFRFYKKEDGLSSNEFNANACLKAQDGKLYFGSDHGIVSFYPDSIRNNPIPPVVHLTDLRLNNQSAKIDAEGSPLTKHISFTKQIDLSYSQRSFAIDFVATNYGQSSRNLYCYKLEGFDEEWNCGVTNNRATYTNMDPGHYVFLVKASNSDGVLSKAPARLEITIHQTPWRSWWALILYALILVGFVHILIKIRVERINMKNQLELERLAREKEHALSESKAQFFTNISHEFRTPLSLITMPLENLLALGDLPATIKERLGTIRMSVDKMMRLVNELMDFNKLEDSKLKLRIEHGELVQFITKVASEFHDMAAKRNIHFGIHSMVPSLEGWFDPDKLEKILMNLLSNAFKFTANNGQINIILNAKVMSPGGGNETARCFELVVVDNGIGIPADELPFIFDKFYQARSSTQIAEPGTGIGLSLTKGLVELHHGSIQVESTPGLETTFKIQIPIDRQIYSDDEICELHGYISTTADSEREFEHAAVDNPEQDPDRAQILVVEDNDELRKYIALELRPQFIVLEAKDGKEGLDVAFERTPDLIISDIMMPLRSGIDFCREIKANIKTSHIPFVLLTAKTTIDDQIAGIATGADVYLTKPFSMRFLLTHVNQIIESRQKLYARFSQDVYLMPGKVASNEIDQAFLQKAIDFIVANIQDPQLGVDSIADLFNLSRMQVYRKVKALTGKSVVEFIRMVRMKQALKLMDTHKYTLSEVAYQAGFNSSSYFTRCFKEEFGKTPSEYLQQA